MNKISTPVADDLKALLVTDPDLFEATTAFRVAMHGEPGLRVTSDIGVSPAAVPVRMTIGSGMPRGRAVVTALPSLSGVLGALPPSYDELAMREERARSGALTAFLDLFGARMNELFVDAAEKYRLARLLRWSIDGARNRFLTALDALAGLGTRKLARERGIDEAVTRRFAGYFADRTRNAASLKAMLAEFSGLPVEIEMFRPRWLPVPAHERSTLAGAARLGVNAMAGTAIRDCSGGLRVVLGPLSYADYARLAPGGSAVQALGALTRLYVGAGLDVDFQIVLRREDVPFCRLGSDGPEARLGWNSWARSAPARADSRDAIIRLNTSSAPEAAHAP